ncbi:MAG: PTS sugar transporter subunit IIB [Anaerolineales bacterium]
MPVKRIIVACGSGVATSNVAAEKLRGLLEDRGMRSIEVRAVDIKSLESEAKLADLLVTITPGSQRDTELGIPVLNGIPLLTNVGAGKLADQIVELAKK